MRTKHLLHLQDLAALLPNLATVRRPSKSAIVNSSIALVHSHRRQRLLAARELRLLRSEGDALRRELNEWRDRAGLPRVEEPPRSPEFFALMNAGAEGAEGEGGGEGWWAAPGLGEMGEEERRAYELVVRGQQDEEDEGMEGEEEEYVAAVAARAGNFGKIGAANANANNNIALQHIAPRFQQQQQQQQQQQMSFTRSNGGSIGGPALGFDGMPSHPALGAGVHTMYEPNGHPHGASHALPVHPAFDQHHHQHQSHHHHHQSQQHSQHSQEQEKLAWGMNSGLYASAIAQPQWAHQVQVGHHAHAHGHGQQNAQALFTPPGTAGSANGGGAPSPVNFTLGSGVGVGSLGHGHVYASPELDDASSVGSVERGGSGSVGGGSPGPHGGGGSQGSFDMMAGMYGRKPSLSLDVGVGAGAGWNGVSSGQLPIPVPVPVSAGGGGGGNGGRHLNAMMMMM